MSEPGTGGEAAATVAVDEVVLSTPPPAELQGRIDAPKAGWQLPARNVQIVGWALGREIPAVAAEAWCEGSLVARSAVDIPRPDLELAFPGAPGAATGGFRLAPPLFGLAGAVEIEVRAVLADQRRVPIATVRGRRLWRAHPEQDRAELVSVVIPCFGQAHFLPQAIESALDQTHPQVQVIVVDDGSLDNTSAVAGRYTGVRVIRRENGGLASARNAGLAEARGEWVVFLDADDRLLPGALAAGLAALAARPDAAFAAGRYLAAAADGSLLDTEAFGGAQRDPYEALLRSNWTGMPATCVFRRDLVQAVGGFDHGVSAAADYDLCLRLARAHAVASHDEPVAVYRRYSTSMSADSAAMLAAVMTALRRQRGGLREPRRLRTARREGRRFWRGDYGEPAVTDTRVALRELRLRRTARNVRVLARNHPAGLLALARAPRA